MGPLYVGIDVGTSNIKICVFNCKREIVSYGSRDTVVLSPKEGYMEIDLKDVLSKVVELLRIVVEGYEQDVVSIDLATSPTIVLLDKKLKTPAPGILYLDNRVH